jgi:hypothetical protein
MLRLVAIAGLLAGLWPVEGYPAEDGDAATIINSGSTNRPGFRIVVDRSGAAEWTSTPRRIGPRQAQPASIRLMLPQTVVAALYADLAKARPLGSLPGVHCAKSVSFGTTLIVALGDEQTPDLSCGDGGSAVLRDLIGDAGRIVDLMLSNQAEPKSGIQ